MEGAGQGGAGRGGAGRGSVSLLVSVQQMTQRFQTLIDDLMMVLNLF